MSGSMIEKIINNRAALDSCAGHKFGSIPDDWRENLPITSREMSCTVCGGQMTVRNIMVYREGYAANGGDPDDVLSGLSRT